MFTLTVWESPAAVPAVPLNNGRPLLTDAPSTGLDIVTTGAVASTVKVRAALVPTLPAASLCDACAVYVPSANAAVSDPLPFSEPNVTVVARAAASAPLVDITACFALERRPPWARTIAGAYELCVDLEVDRAALARAAASLLDDVTRFPQRGADPTL